MRRAECSRDEPLRHPGSFCGSAYREFSRGLSLCRFGRFSMDECELPLAEPDEIENHIIRVVSAIGENRIDDRSRVIRFFDRWSFYAQARRDDAIKERWTKQIIIDLLSLGRKLRFEVDCSPGGKWPGYRCNWMYDVVWRDLNTAGDWWTTNSVPLVLSCDWFVPDCGRPGFPPTETLDKLLASRADHRVLICQSSATANTFD